MVSLAQVAASSPDSHIGGDTMAGRRIYITIPERDWYLIRHLAMRSGECQGELSRRWVLQALYSALKRDEELSRYDAQLAQEEREEVLHGR